MNQILASLRGAVVIVLYALNTIFWTTPLFILAFFKFIIPVEGWRLFINRILNALASNWITVNSFVHRMVNRVKWEVQGLEELAKNQWYLVVANHQSWADILVLQRTFNRRIPFLKFFLKKELIWVPVLGQAWWALDFPFMKRYSRSFLEKHPELAGKDLEITRRACEKFKHIPVSVMNFVEGTRFTFEKHSRQGSPYANLLKPKAGGIAFVLAAMGEQMHRMLNVTISYPQGVGNFWEFACGKVSEIRVRVESIPINRELVGDYFQDKEYRQHFQNWLNGLWADKDRKLGEMAG